MSARPVPGRFAKGTSGNPKGRPRKVTPPAASAFDIVIDPTLTVVQNGRARELTVDEALQQKTYQKAIAGSRMAQRAVITWIEKRDAAQAAKRPPKVSYEAVMEEDCNSANTALVLLGIARDTQVSGEPRLKLETWAIEAALDRYRRTGSTKKDFDNARLNALDAKAVRWLTSIVE